MLGKTAFQVFHQVNENNSLYMFIESKLIEYYFLGKWKSSEE